MGRTVLARKSKSKLETETREESKRKGRREGNGAVSNYFYDGAKVGSAFYEGHRCLLLENKIY
jgi:hypothetical protein